MAKIGREYVDAFNAKRLGDWAGDRLILVHPDATLTLTSNSVTGLGSWPQGTFTDAEKCEITRYVVVNARQKKTSDMTMRMFIANRFTQRLTEVGAGVDYAFSFQLPKAEMDVYQDWGCRQLQASREREEKVLCNLSTCQYIRHEDVASLFPPTETQFSLTHVALMRTGFRNSAALDTGRKHYFEIWAGDRFQIKFLREIEPIWTDVSKDVKAQIRHNKPSPEKI